MNEGTEKHAIKSAGLITVTSGTLKAWVKIMIVDTPAKDTSDLFDRVALIINFEKHFINAVTLKGSLARKLSICRLPQNKAKCLSV